MPHTYSQKYELYTSQSQHQYQHQHQHQHQQQTTKHQKVNKSLLDLFAYFCLIHMVLYYTSICYFSIWLKNILHHGLPMVVLILYTICTISLMPLEFLQLPLLVLLVLVLSEVACSMLMLHMEMRWIHSTLLWCSDDIIVHSVSSKSKDVWRLLFGCILLILIVLQQ